VPALAIADVLSGRGYEVHFCGGGTGMERALVTRAGYPFSLVRIRGFKRRLGDGHLGHAGLHPARRGGRLAAPATPAAGLRGGGGRVRIRAGGGGSRRGRHPGAGCGNGRASGLDQPHTQPLGGQGLPLFPRGGRTGGKYLHTGRPIRPLLFAATREEGIARFDLDPGIPVVLVFGGSLGARTLNDATLSAFAREETPFSIIHVTGERDFPRVSQELGRPGGNARYHAYAYLDDFPLALAAATVAVSRAGGSVAELLARGVPALLVPFPLATADHQTKNALALQAAGAAVMVPDGEFDAARMKVELAGLLRSQTLERMRRAALTLARPDAATRIADEIVELAAPRKAT